MKCALKRILSARGVWGRVVGIIEHEAMPQNAIEKPAHHDQVKHKVRTRTVAGSALTNISGEIKGTNGADGALAGSDKRPGAELVSQVGA